MRMSKLILLVDDDPTFVEATKRVLETSGGYRVSTALSVEECLQRLEDELPDLILLDVMMARLTSGFDLCRKIKSDPQRKDIPIALITGIDSKFNFRFRDATGDPDWLPADDFIEKPVEAAVLLQRVKKFLA